MMRILLIGPSPAVPGGIGSWMRLLQAHPPEGVEYVPIYTLTPDTAMANLDKFSSSRMTRLTKNLVQVARIVVTLPRLVAKVKPEGAHIHFASRGSFFRKQLVADQLSKIPLRFILHAHGGKFDQFYNDSSYKKKKLIEKFINQSDGFISLSSAWLDFYRRLMVPPLPKTYIMPNPVIVPDSLPPRTHNPRARLVFLGRIGEHKGSDRVLRAIAMLPKETRSKVEAWFAGDGDVEGLQQLAQELQLERQVVVSRWISPEQRDQWLAQADCFILPSRAEGVPMALLEALAWGLPVISSPVGGIPEVVQHGQEGFLVNPDDVQAISEAIRYMVEHPEVRAQMGYHAYQRAHSFALPVYQSRLKDAYREVFSASA